MTAQPYRAQKGGTIERGRPIDFAFDGQRLRGFAGDTLASALLANGIKIVGRSFKYHRPRGVVSAGSDEPNALVTVGRGAFCEPNARATMIEVHDGLVARSQNAWPSRQFDIGAINNLISPLIPAAFYYKTFMGGPKNAWTRVYEPAIRRIAGLGKAPDEPDGDAYDKRNTHCDLLIVGGGAAGLAAALAASKHAARIILVDENPTFGGSLRASADLIEGTPATKWAGAAAAELSRTDHCLLLSRTTAFGRYDHGLVMALERLTDHNPKVSGPRHRLWQIRARRIILATGAHEQPSLFGNNDLPGVMLAHSGKVYARHFGVLAGRRVLINTFDNRAEDVAIALADAGAEVVGIVSQSQWQQKSHFNIHQRAAVVKAIGGRQVKAAEIMTESGHSFRTECDTILMSGGWQPALHLYSHVGGKTQYDDRLQCFVAARALPDVELVGGCAGRYEINCCLLQGNAAAKRALRVADISKSVAPSVIEGRTDPHGDQPFATDPIGKCFVDFQNDVTTADIGLAAREGFVSVEHLKRYTTTGMATDQGKTSNLNALKRMAALLELEPGTVGTTTFRPPYTPVSFGALAGPNIGHFMDPVRHTPMHDLHVALGAVFENVGRWKRAWFYPQGAEKMEDAVRRECRAVRTSVGIFDGSTLGKIDIRGPDSAKFIDLVYTNSWKSLEIGRCRYGLMLDENGMVIDDGVTTRTGADRYLMTTTTGNAALVMGHLEEFLQSEWPELQVYLTSVTEHWAVAVVAGPKARNVLEPVVTGLDLSNEAFPHLSMREGVVGKVPVRIYRISFTGELSYEVHVEAQNGVAITEALYEAGERFGVTPFGTEAMHVLRAEKGYIIVGQETDGTVTPFDLGLERMVSKTKSDFIGKRSLVRPHTAREDRRQLVGLRSVDRVTIVDEGAQLVGDLEISPPVRKLGHVTSSYWSDAANGPIALGLLISGSRRHGEVVYAWSRGRTTACEVCAPIFYDDAGVRLNE